MHGFEPSQNADLKYLHKGKLADVQVRNIPRQWNVKLNELAQQILMPLPLLLLLYVLIVMKKGRYELSRPFVQTGMMSTNERLALG